MDNKNNNNITGKAAELISKSGPLVALILLCIFLAFKNENFFTSTNLLNVARQAALNGFLSLGMMVCILTAGIDLSIGYTMTLSTIIMAKCAVEAGVNPVLCLLIGILTGGLLGLVNGLLLTKCKLPHPFISTLGTQNIYKGIGLVITGATPIAGMPAVVKWAGSAFLSSNQDSFLGKIPLSFVIMLIVYALFSVFLNYTTLGRHIYAVGGNCTSQQKLDTNFKFFYSKDWFSVQCYGCLDTSLFGWLECIRYGVIVKPACAPLMRLRALQSLHT